MVPELPVRDLAAGGTHVLVLVASVQAAHQALCDTWGPLRGLEKDRAERFVHEADRRSYESAHLLLREATRRWCGASDQQQLALSYECPTCGSSEHGRPRLPAVPEVQISLSHAREHVAVGVSLSAIGVDVEDADRPVTPADLRGFMTQSELGRAHGEATGLLETWTRKEALVKAGAAGLDEIGGHDVTADVCTLGDETWTVRSYRADGWVLSVASDRPRLPDQIRTWQP